MASNFPFRRKALEAWTVYAGEGPNSRSVLCFNPDTMAEYSILKKRPADVWAPIAPSTHRKADNNEKNINRLAAEFNSVDQSQIDVRPLRVTLAQMVSRAASSGGVRRCVMPDMKSAALLLAAAFGGLSATSSVSAQEQSAIDAAQELAQMLDETSVEISGDYLLSALEGAAAAGEPMALWQLGVMYESGIGVEKDQGKAFGYFAQIANENAEMSRVRPEADIVAQSFVKVGTYYSQGIPDAGVPSNPDAAYKSLYHAATVFGDPDAQYQLYLTEQKDGYLPAQSARWLALAARKGHPGAQARLGDLLVTGEGVEPQPVEGLMWLNLAYRGALGTGDEGWIGEMAQHAMAMSSEEEINAAVRAADTLGAQFSEY